ncbi:MAG: SDR family NAD(P)-dependent oxidoreductase [Deltaproteobacteria bacterium]|nr:SDR family NAD(P)-dependent oxidoreductase [Deltaproteobacteria bacterium]
MAFTGKVALITGAGSGMGQLAAQNLARAGASVAALDIDEAGLERTRAARQCVDPHLPCRRDALGRGRGRDRARRASSARSIAR